MANQGLTEEDKEQLKQELLKVGLYTLREAKRRAPVDTGRLRASLTVADSDGLLQNTGPEARAKDGIDTPQGKFTVRVGTNVPYSVFIEYGTGKMDKQPFLRPAKQAAMQRFDLQR